MEENGNADSNRSTQYIRSNNMGNTIDNKQRHTKEEDPMNPDYTNPPIGKERQHYTSENSGSDDSETMPPGA